MIRPHKFSCLTLALLVPLIGRADHVDASLATDDLAVFTNAFDARADFHDETVLARFCSRLDLTGAKFPAEISPCRDFTSGCGVSTQIGTGSAKRTCRIVRLPPDRPTPSAAQVPPQRNREIICQVSSERQAKPPRKFLFVWALPSAGQNERPVRGQGHRMLEMDAGLAVFGPHRPVVGLAGAGSF
jgi:hypothetical protein